MPKQKKVHIIGICGKTTAPLAKMFQDLGWQVSGSDQGFYPPASDYLAEHKILVSTPYNSGNIPPEADLVVVGGNALIVDKDNPEYLRAQELGLEILSYPEVLQKYLVKDTSVVVVGAYGKGTIAAILSWILERAGQNPSFMIGGQPGNFADGVRATNSTISVLEGDEHPTLNYSPQPKFMYYQPTHVILTSVEWDHYNVFKTEEMYMQAYEELMRILPSDGLVLACPEGKNVEKVIQLAPCRVLTYGVDGNFDYQARKTRFDKERTSLQVVYKDEVIELDTGLFGRHNVQNLVGAVGMARELNVSVGHIKEAVASYKNMAQRLEIAVTASGRVVVRDLAHSPAKARATLAALRTRYKKNRIFCVFDMHSSSLREPEILNKFNDVFKDADVVVIPKVLIRADTPKKKRVTGKQIVEAIEKTHKNALYLPNDDQLVNYLVDETESGDVVVFMSSGGLRGIVEKVVNGI